MESDCCGGGEWLEDSGICNICMEHAEFYDTDEDYPCDVINDF